MGMASSRQADGGHGAGDGPPPQCTFLGVCGGGAERGEAQVTYDVLRGQKGSPPGSWQALLSEVAGPQRRSSPDSAGRCAVTTASTAPLSRTS